MLRNLRPALIMMMFLTACASEPENKVNVTSGRPTPVSAPDTRPVILAFGNSLTAGHGVELADSYPSRLQRELDGRGYQYRVVNAGVSGDTTAGGLSRIDYFLAGKPKIVILELGANDGLRGLPVEQTKGNLEQIIVRSQAAGSAVVLAGMTLPLNLGPDYIRAFERMFSDLATQHRTTWIPFFLEGVAARTDMNQEDGMHPTGKGYAVITEMVFRHIEPLLQK